MMLHGSLILKHLFQRCQVNMLDLIDDDTAAQYFNDIDTATGDDLQSKSAALEQWATIKKREEYRDRQDHIAKIYTDFDKFSEGAGLSEFSEDARYQFVNSAFVANETDGTAEDQMPIYPSKRDEVTDKLFGKTGLSEKETFGLIKQSIDARNEVTEAANQIPGDIALSLFDSIGGGDPVDVPKLIETWKTKNAESIKKLPPGWETPLLESAQAFHTETEGMLRDYAEPLKKVYDHFSAVTGRDTERAGETNPKNEEEMDSMVDTLASMPKPVRERAYASVVLGAKKAGQDPKTFMDQWGESWSRTLNMVRTGALTAQEMAAESDLRMLENKETPPDYFISKSTGEKIPLANSAFHDEADLRKVTPEEIAADAAKARQKVKRFEVIRELKNVADNQFDPIEKINKGGFLGFMESMAYGSPQGLAITATALVPFVGPYLAGAAMFSDEYDQLRSQGMNVDQAIQVGSVSAAIQAGMERTGAKALFGKLPVFEKLMRKIGNPARVGKAGSAGVRFLTAATGEQLVEGAQDLTTPLVQDVAEALGADVPDVKWQPILEKWEGSRLDVLAASLPTIFFGTGVASFADNKRFAQFEERQDIYRMTGMDDAAIKKIEDGKDLAEVQQNFQTEFGKLTPENVKAGVSYIEGKITSAQEQQQDSNTHTLTRETLADGSKKFVIRDPKGEVTYSTADAQTAQIAISELLRNQITGTTRGIFESMSFFNQMNEAAGRGEDIQKFLLSDAPRDLLTDYEANPTEKNLDNLFKTVRAFGQDISEPAELANFPVLASNQGALSEGIFKSVIQIHEGATGDKVVRDVAQDNLKRAIAEQRITMDWVRENLNQIIPQIDSKRITGYRLRTETDTDVIESFSDVALAYMVGDVREDQIPAGFRGFLRRIAIVVKDIYRRAYNLKRLVAEGKVDANFESLLADSVGLNQQARVDTASQRVAGDVLADTDGKVVFSRAQAQSNAGEIRASNATITGPANYSIAAHHGTPHKVDKFTTAKIGTGEGAQAYGWGLYFAENKGVAQKYRDDLTPDPVAKINKHLSLIGLGGHSASSKLAEKLVGNGGDLSLASSEFRKEGNKQIADLIDNKIKEGRKSLNVNKGNLYTAELDVEPEDLLDWDKPISEQSPKVKAALQSVSDNWLWQDAISGKGGEQVGGALYSTLRATFPDAEFSRDGVDASKKASEALLAAGIPGIRYLDGGSRGPLQYKYEVVDNSNGEVIKSFHTKSHAIDFAAGEDYSVQINDNPGTYNYVAFDENLIRITEENGNRIAAADALAAPATGATNYSIGMTVAPLRRDSLSELNKKEMQKRASSAKFIHLQQVIDDVANAYGVKIESRQPVIGGWVEGGQISLEVPEAVLFDTDDLEMAQEMAAIVGASAPELQNAVMLWKDDDGGKDTVLEFQAKGADSALAIAKDLNAAGLNGFTYDTKTRKFSLVLAGVSPESLPKVYDFITRHTKQGSISSRGGTQARSGAAAFPSESDYRGYLQGARSRAGLLQQGQREALLDVVDRAERRIDRYAAALKISEQAKKIQKKLKRPSTSALDIETELKGKKFDNIRQLGLYLDSRFNKVFGKPSFEIGGQEGIDIASDAFVYDIIDGLAGDGSGMGWYDERVQETIRELSKLHPEFATDSNALAVYIGILATTSQGYTVVENFKQANKVYNEYKRTGRIPEDFKFAKSSEPINSNLAQIQGLIDEHGLDGYAEFMDQEVTGQALREQFGKTPTGVTLKDKVRGNRVLGPKIGSFFNNLRGQFDTITMDLWYTRTMHRFLGETVVPLDSDKMQNAITKFREELKKDGVRTYGIDLTEALKDDEATVQAGLTLFQRWARGDNEYTEKGYFKFPDGYKIEKFARGIFSIGGMKGAPQNKTHRQYFAKVVLEAKAKLAKLGMKLTEADMQAIIWYREKNLFARTGVANAAAKPADYLDAVMVARSGAQVQEDVDPADLESEDGDTNYSIASQSEIDRVNKALGGMNRGPDERLKVYQRAKNSFSRVMQENKEALDAIRSSVSTDTAPATERVEMDRAGKMADVSSEEKTELEKALQDNADTFLPRIEAAQTPAERKKVERDAKDRAKILEQGIRDKFAERKKSVDAEAKSQRDQIVQAAAAKDSASNARMRDKVRNTKLVNAIGELDGILKALPPEVRGRVGGFAVLANIGTGDKALADFFVQRIDMIDRQLERTLKEEYGTQFDALLERTKPKKAKAGEKPKGIGADIQSLFSAVREARGWNPDKVDGHIANLETQIAAGNLTPEEEAWLTREADLVSLAGDWKNADSSRRAAALEAATETWAKGMYEFVQKKMQEREARDIARAEAIKATGKKGDYPDRRARSEADNGLKGKSHGWLMDTMSWDQVAGIVFGHESPIAIELSDGQRKAEYTKIDAVQAKEDAIHDLFTQLAGGSRLEGEKLMWKMSQPSIDAGGLNLSQLEALSPTMLWAQEDGRRHMIGQLDETGNPTSRWHYNQQFIDDIESQLSPEAKVVRDFLWDSYEKEWFSINSVNRELNGISLPRIFKYSPVTVNPINVPAGMVSDPVTGNTVSAGSISPGALRTRGTAIAQPNFRNVISTYIAHTRQMEHWKAFAPWTKVANGILRNRDVQDSIHEAGGEEANKVLTRFLDAFAQGGNRDASLGLEIAQTLTRMYSRAAQVALVGRVGTLAIQFTQIGAASAELPMGAYVSRLGKLMTGNLGWADALNSPYIQRRIKQMPLTVQIAMEGLKAGKPTQLKHQVTKVGQLISGSDALWTAGTYAMVYDYHLGQAKSFGYTGQAAEEYAHNTAERVTDRLAQPMRMGARSVYEITSTNPGAKLGFAFASEARKNIALLAYTKANRSKGQFGTAALGFVLFNLAMGAFIRNAWKDMRDDDDDELLDDKTWNWKRIGVAMLTEPLQGIPYLGDYIEKGINAALGQYHQSSDLISFERGVRAIKHIPDIIDGERDMEGVLKDIDGMVSLMGMFNQSAAAAASLTHIASDFFGVAKNATTED